MCWHNVFDRRWYQKCPFNTWLLLEYQLICLFLDLVSSVSHDISASFTPHARCYVMTWKRNAFRITSPVRWESTGHRVTKGPVILSFRVFFDASMNKLWTQTCWRWFETLCCPLGRYFNALNFIWWDLHNLTTKSNFTTEEKCDGLDYIHEHGSLNVCCYP